LNHGFPECKPMLWKNMV